MSDGKLLLSLKTGFKSLMLNFRQSTLLLLFYWLTLLLLMTIMNLLQGLNSSQSWLVLILLILGMQITILLRYFLQFFVVGWVYQGIVNAQSVQN
ncbi:MAG: hypothetical protein IPL23_24060 [Saprospiraceae bacterium]|nr:hypothetical protein [Saprospiraceae bacterium]